MFFIKKKYILISVKIFNTKIIKLVKLKKLLIIKWLLNTHSPIIIIIILIIFQEINLRITFKFLAGDGIQWKSSRHLPIYYPNFTFLFFGRRVMTKLALSRLSMSQLAPIPGYTLFFPLPSAVSHFTWKCFQGGRGSSYGV